MGPRIPSLALASSLFAVVSAAAGWFWCDLFANPLVGGADRAHRVPVALCAGLAGALAGLLLAPGGPREEGQAPRPSGGRVVAVVLAAGALAGGLVVALHVPENAPLGAVNGLLCAVPFLPAAALAIAALRRAGEARRGSIVARAGVRAIVATAAAILGASTLLAILDWPAAAGDFGAPPREVTLVLLAAAAVVIGLLAADARAAARIRRLASQVDALPDGCVDLGVGDALVTRPAPGTAYRGGGATVASVAGDFDEAEAALARSIRRGAVALALLEVVGLAHGLARETDAAADFGALVCDAHHPTACRSAALLAERAGRPDKDAADLHQRACDGGVVESCTALVLMQRLAAGP